MNDLTKSRRGDTAGTSKHSGPPGTVESVDIRAFRGIPDRLTVALPAVGKNPTSLLVLGDNGSGKSSIVDALQFGLQCEIRGVRGNASIALAQSKATQDLPSVRIRLSDSQEIVRDVWREERKDGQLVPRVNGHGVAGFAKTPLVLRRADILRFWETPAEQRELVFLRYFKPGATVNLELPHERVARLQGEKGRATAARRAAVRALADAAEVNPAQIPLDLDGFNA